MKHNRIAGSVAVGIAAAAVACGTAHAAPADAASSDERLHVDIAPGIEYTSDLADRSVVVGTPLGFLATRGPAFQILDSQGVLVAGTPRPDGHNTTAQSAGTELPSDATVPVSQPGALAAATAPGAEPQAHAVDATADYGAALGVAATQFGIAATTGTIAGGVIGLGVGCIGGALTGGFTALPTGPVAVPAAAFGCLIGASLGAAIGTVAGAALLGIPVGIASAAQMYDTLHAAGDI